MRRIGRRLALVALASLVHVASGEDVPKARPTARSGVDAILEGWHQRMAKVESIDASFRGKSTNQVGGGMGWEGRIVLGSPNFAMIEHAKVGKEGGSPSLMSKIIWNGGERLAFDDDRRQVVRSRRMADASRPPLHLSLPFLFRLSAEEAREQCDWEIVGETEGRICLAATPRVGKARPFDPSRYLVTLDRDSSLPVRLVVEEGPQDRDTYEFGDLKLGRPIDEDLMRPCLDAWWIAETPDWLAWLYP